MEIREQICDVCHKMWQLGWVAANDGNVSVKLPDGNFLVTPTGISKSFITPEKLVIIDKDMNIVEAEGNYKPSSEIKMHMRCYTERDDVGAVVHAHPPYATTFSVAHIPLDTYILPEAICALGAVPIVPYAQPSTQELADRLIPYLQEYDAFILENHGTVTVGTDLIKAYYKTETLEYNAKITYLTKILGRWNELPKEEIQKLIVSFKQANPESRHPGYRKF